MVNQANDFEMIPYSQPPCRRKVFSGAKWIHPTLTQSIVANFTERSRTSKCYEATVTANQSNRACEQNRMVFQKAAWGKAEHSEIWSVDGGNTR
mmetsp:Transcript_14869/g.22108  ORF Transcript_14869/g.22108 Transcript_14869/m.22108 type:complete len:94 (+) Transcript_14869:534-815(+)